MITGDVVKQWNKEWMEDETRKGTFLDCSEFIAQRAYAMGMERAAMVAFENRCISCGEAIRADSASN